MKIIWETVQDRYGIGCWFISEPIGSFINIFPIVKDSLTFKLEGPAGSKEYLTLKEAKKAGEFMFHWMENNPPPARIINENVCMMLPWDCPLP